MDVHTNVCTVVRVDLAGIRTDIRSDEHSDNRTDILIVLTCDKGCRSGPYSYLPRDTQQQQQQQNNNMLSLEYAYVSSGQAHRSSSPKILSAKTLYWATSAYTLVEVEVLL